MKLDNTSGLNSRTKKLTLEQVRKIRKDFAAGKRGTTEAKKYGISVTTYNCCGRKATWKTVE